MKLILQLRSSECGKASDVIPKHLTTKYITCFVCKHTIHFVTISFCVDGNEFGLQILLFRTCYVDVCIATTSVVLVILCKLGSISSHQLQVYTLRMELYLTKPLLSIP